MKKLTRLEIALIVIVAQTLGTVAYTLPDLLKRDERRELYKQTHKCSRHGFAGKDATPVYMCDNGLYLETELDDLVKREMQ